MHESRENKSGSTKSGIVNLFGNFITLRSHITYSREQYTKPFNVMKHFCAAHLFTRYYRKAISAAGSLTLSYLRSPYQNRKRRFATETDGIPQSSPSECR